MRKIRRKKKRCQPFCVSEELLGSQKYMSRRLYSHFLSLILHWSWLWLNQDVFIPSAFGSLATPFYAQCDPPLSPETSWLLPLGQSLCVYTWWRYRRSPHPPPPFSRTYPWLCPGIIGDEFKRSHRSQESERKKTGKLAQLKITLTSLTYLWTLALKWNSSIMLYVRPTVSCYYTAWKNNYRCKGSILFPRHQSPRLTSLWWSVNTSPSFQAFRDQTWSWEIRNRLFNSCCELRCNKLHKRCNPLVGTLNPTFLEH